MGLLLLQSRQGKQVNKIMPRFRDDTRTLGVLVSKCHGYGYQPYIINSGMNRRGRKTLLPRLWTFQHIQQKLSTRIHTDAFFASAGIWSKISLLSSLCRIESTRVFYFIFF